MLVLPSYAQRVVIDSEGRIAVVAFRRVGDAELARAVEIYMAMRRGPLVLA